MGVLIGDKKKLYLFDFTLGLPIPGPGGVAADKSGQLQVFPATLDQVAADRKLLERLSLKARSAVLGLHGRCEKGRGAGGCLAALS